MERDDSGLFPIGSIICRSGAWRTQALVIGREFDSGSVTYTVIVGKRKTPIEWYGHPWYFADPIAHAEWRRWRAKYEIERADAIEKRWEEVRQLAISVGVKDPATHRSAGSSPADTVVSGEATDSVQ